MVLQCSSRADSYMSDLRKSCNLSQLYTNHSIRATGATVLSKGMYGPAQIMAVTGHKYVQSLSVYQRVDDDEKLQTLTNALIPNSQSTNKLERDSKLVSTN